MLIQLSRLALALTAIGRVTRAQHVDFTPPQVVSLVDEALSLFVDFVDYRGPTGTAKSATQTSSKAVLSQPTATAAPYWLENIQHQGVAPFSGESGYQVFRNVKDFGAVGDGVTDDTNAINSAISSGGRCAPGSCNSTTTTPAVVYFPAGTYLISSSIIDYYLTQLIGDPNSLPTLLATPDFNGFGLVDGDLNSGFISTVIFYRQVRNLIFDMTKIPSSSSATGIHWDTSQATSLQNVVFKMSDAPDTQHIGLFIEGGSGGFMTDLVFYGGLYGANIGNQQFTMRNMTFYNVATAINQIWEWGWTYKSISFNNCSVGLNMAAGGSTNQAVGSVTLIDSSIKDTSVGILMAHNSTSLPAAAGALILENVDITNVSVIVQGPGSSTFLAGTTGSTIISGWGEGHEYVPTGPTNFEGSITPFARPASLLSGSKYYERSKPQYNTYSVSQFSSVRSGGATGDGSSDDTAALQNVINHAAAVGNIVFFDAGIYKVTSTLSVPAGSKIVGESYSVIMSSGSHFADMSNPQPVVRVGNAGGEVGQVEWSDMIVSTQGAQAGAVLIEWNIISPTSAPSGIWDVHARVGGFTGSDLQAAQCPITPSNTTVNENCIAGFMTMHVTQPVTGLYLENVWLWTADHDIDAPDLSQLTIYNGRGLYVESTAGGIWLYYQPNPNATLPFPPISSLNDPDFETSCSGISGNCATAWGLRIVDSQSILIYGADFYSFFSNYSTNCSAVGNGENCQTAIFSIEGDIVDVDVYNLNTIGTTNMIMEDGSSIASYSDNVNNYPDTIALFRSN